MELWQSTMENMVINQTFWKDKKVLLTGHTGFKGSWLSLWLQKLGSDVIGFSRDIPTKPSLFELCNVADDMISIMGDICNIEHLRTVMTEHKPEIVIHMAAQSLVGRSYDNPLETFSTNVLGTVNVFEVIRKIRNVRVVINVTSDKCYENRESISGYKETDPMGGYDPYSCSKGCAELVTSSFRNSFFNPKEYDKHGIALASVRAGNIIGGGDWSPNRLVPDIMKGLIENQTVTIRNPSSVRPWQFVLEPLRGYLMLAEKLWHEGPRYVEGWNFGPDDQDVKPVFWLIEKISQKWGKKVNWNLNNTHNYHETNYLRLDCSKAKMKLGWSPKLNMEKTIEFVVEWYKQFEKNQDVKGITEEQISKYNSL